MVAAGKNFSNLFEMPVLFYVLTILLMVGQRSDALYVGLAWVYVAFRYAHSVVHLTTNVILLRVVTFALSNVALMVMWGRFATQVW